MIAPLSRRERPYEQVRPFVAFVRWRTPAAGRALARESVGTLQGRLMVLMWVVALPGLFGLLATGGPLGAANLDEVSTIGALFLGQLGLALCVFATVPVLVAKSLIHTHEQDPAAAHGGFRPELAVLRVAASVIGTAAFLGLFFALVHGSLVTSGAEGSAGVRFGLFATLTAQLALPGVLAAEGARRFLAGPRVLNRADAVRAAGAIPFLVLFPAFVWLPLLAHRSSVEALGWMGRAVEGGFVALEPGAALVRAAAEGRVAQTFGWIAALTMGLLGSGWVLARWLDLAPAALCCPEGNPVLAGGPRTLPLAPRAEGPRSPLALFLWKDVFLEGARRPVARLGLSALLLAGTCVLGTELAGAPVVLAASAGLSLPALGALGREGPALPLLRPAVRPGRLFRVKWVVGWVESAGQVPAHVLAMTLVAAAGGPPPTSIPVLLALGLAASLGFSLLGTGLGFLLPDPRRRSFFLPGASRTGQVIYLSVATSLIAVLA